MFFSNADPDPGPDPGKKNIISEALPKILEKSRYLFYQTENFVNDIPRYRTLIFFK